MRSNREMRQEAWKIVRGKWFCRILLAFVILLSVSTLVQDVVRRMYGGMNIHTWTEFAQAKYVQRLSDLADGWLSEQMKQPMPEPMRANLETMVKPVQALGRSAEDQLEDMGVTTPWDAAGWRMTGASVFELLVSYLFLAILLFGLACVTLKAIRDETEHWLGESMTGFRRPLGMLWFLTVLNLRVFLWSLLFVIPGVIAAYRYRQAWYLKVEHPDWGVAKSLAESARIMKGRKLKAFGFDLSFAGWWLLLCVLLVLSSNFVFMLLSAGLFAFLACYYSAGRAVFYREVKAASEAQG